MTNFAPGDRVKHKQLGDGTVLCTKQKGKTIIIVVTFDDFSYLLDDNEFPFFPKELKLIETNIQTRMES